MDSKDPYHKLCGKVALVTGASSGIGAAICKAFVCHGIITIGIARNIQPIEKLKQELQQERGSLVAFKCDLTKDDQILAVFEDVKRLYGGVDICINNAAMSFAHSLLDASPDEWRTMMNVNVIGPCYCSKLAIASMQERNVNDGHIINISSVAAHIQQTSTPIHFYAATKHALRVITESIRLELRAKKSRIRVSSISPGVVETNFFRRLFNSEIESQKILSSHVNLSSEDVTRSILHILSAPPHVEINDIIMRPVEQEA